MNGNNRQPIAFTPASEEILAKRQINPLLPQPVTVNESLLWLYEQNLRPVYYIYEPAQISIVLGAGRKNKGDIVTERTVHDQIPVLDRLGGGGTVVLAPGMVVLALVTEVASYYRNLEYARTINGWIKEALQNLGVQNLEDKGIADLATGEKKLLGSSLYRRKSLLFYQASLLVNNDLTLFERYLTFPSRVPDYRQERSHLDFCTNLEQLGYSLTVKRVMAELETLVLRYLPVFQ